MFPCSASKGLWAEPRMVSFSLPAIRTLVPARDEITTDRSALMRRVCLRRICTIYEANGILHRLSGKPLIKLVFIVSIDDLAE